MRGNTVWKYSDVSLNPKADQWVWIVWWKSDFMSCRVWHYNDLGHTNRHIPSEAKIMYDLEKFPFLWQPPAEFFKLGTPKLVLKKMTKFIVIANLKFLKTCMHMVKGEKRAW